MDVNPTVQRIPVEDGDLPTNEAATRRHALLIPPRFEHATFATFDPHTDAQRAALDGVQEWVRRALREAGPMLALIGTQGVGKSHLLYAAVRDLLDSGCAIYARSWYRLADELRYGGPSPFAPEKLLEAHAKSRS